MPSSPSTPPRTSAPGGPRRRICQGAPPPNLPGKLERREHGGRAGRWAASALSEELLTHLVGRWRWVPHCSAPPAQMCTDTTGRPTEARRTRWQVYTSSTRCMSACSRRRSSASASGSRRNPRTPCRKCATSARSTDAPWRTRCRPRTFCAPLTASPSRSASRPVNPKHTP